MKEHSRGTHAGRLILQPADRRDVGRWIASRTVRSRPIHSKKIGGIPMNLRWIYCICKLLIVSTLFLPNAPEDWIEHCQCVYLALLTFTMLLPRVSLENRFTFGVSSQQKTN